MQYAVFVYVSSAQAVIQDLFLFLFKTKKRERSEIIDRAKRRRAKQAARETSTLLWGKEKSKRTKNHTKTDFYIFFAKNLFISKKSSIFALEISKSFPFMGQQSKNTILC